MGYTNISKEQYKQIREYVQMTFECSAHDFDHTLRVKNNALLIAADEKVRMDVLLPAIYLHDIARASSDKSTDKSINHAIEGGIIARTFLKDINFNDDLISEICHCIESHNYRSSIEPISLEAKILFDADKLDGLGATGIARLFAMSGKYGNSIYMSDDLKVDLKTKEKFLAPNLEYKRKHINLIHKLYFQKSKEIAKERLEFMNEFFQRLRREIESID